MKTPMTLSALRYAIVAFTLVGLSACTKDKPVPDEPSGLERPTDLPRPPGNRLPDDLRPPRAH